MTTQILIIILMTLFVVPQEQKQAADSTAALDVTYCELVSNPKLYVGKLVRVKATWVYGIEWTVLLDRECQKRDKNKAISDIAAWAEIDEDQLCATSEKNLKKFREKGFERGANVVVIGKLYDKGNYGYQNSYKYKFVVSCLESAEKISRTP